MDAAAGAAQFVAGHAREAPGGGPVDEEEEAKGSVVAAADLADQGVFDPRRHPQADPVGEGFDSGADRRQGLLARRDRRRDEGRFGARAARQLPFDRDDLSLHPVRRHEGPFQGLAAGIVEGPVSAWVDLQVGIRVVRLEGPAEPPAELEAGVDHVPTRNSELDRQAGRAFAGPAAFDRHDVGPRTADARHENKHSDHRSSHLLTIVAPLPFQETKAALPARPARLI